MQYISDQFDVFDSSPTLKFRLSWSSESAGAMVERPRPLMPRGNNAQQDLRASKDSGKSSSSSSSISNGGSSSSNAR